MADNKEPGELSGLSDKGQQAVHNERPPYFVNHRSWSPPDDEFVNPNIQLPLPAK